MTGPAPRSLYLPDHRTGGSLETRPGESAMDGPALLPVLLGLVLLHLALGVGVSIDDRLVRVHGALVIGATLLAAVTDGAARLPYAFAYVAGSEVLWRFMREGLPWETAKYLCILAGALALMRFRSTSGPPWLLVAFALLLLPSVLVPAGQPDISDRSLRQGTLTTLAPAFALLLMSWALRSERANRPNTITLLLALALPIVSIAALTGHRTLTATQIVFTGESNFATSGGFGPNQVSTVLGVGALACTLVAALHRRLLVSLVALLVAAGLAVQSAMTFSRGGLYAAVLAIVAGMLMAPGSPVVRRALVPAAAALVGGLAVVLPIVNGFTGGFLLKRFQETGTTNRWELLLDDLQLYFDHPLLGVGPGQSKHARVTFEGAASHTEFTRMLSEHGSLGLVAMLCLFAYVLGRVRRAPDADHRFVIVSITAWALASQLHAALRTLAPVLMLALLATQLSHRARDTAPR
ncbi:MAG: O-antigen ligase family protein [Gemmatimonas sp.]|uniref:O-antigen ligase family protein n=1 Tax=Gemmatimonas sp. TaxID=1962908 RepID=UPI003919A76C